ncbi:LytR/AlgR family response regulator transcription factor [Polaribacter dokdonensis]|uniref:Sensory transduction protein lytT n=1 Tax=Polaribacter dokdonensis DSW-5 TaxID=1300348 RepID=A0A0M9CFC4_9FLAO|nr:LytTR family DNA-binding domain-containing protein [Polaribacter dokdonensis]KOY50795.1 Sensory transduction protein lytT [Polaribacter dokdonensis DSW-5]SEE25909.1 two component transcriptional regulator, LytTR family [Polaribacter dokdonensis DSW-5]
MKKVIIVDDEKAGRKLIKEYLSNFPALILLGEANNGVDAVKMINEFKPDLVFLDIQMPGLTGFDVLKHLEELPQIIFSTAYDQYALKAFEVHAVDYLLKPYTQERFKVAVEKVTSNIADNKAKELTNSLLMDAEKYPQKILVQAKNKLVTISVKDIIRIEAYGDYSKIITEEKTFISNYGISQLEQKLDEAIFLRVHRSSIINIDKIEELNKYGKSYDVTMQNKDIVRVSRGYMETIKKLMY